MLALIEYSGVMTVKKQTRKLPKGHNPKLLSEQDIDYFSRLEGYFERSLGTTIEKLENFAKYVPRQNLTRFIYRYELFKRILSIQGAIVECGVYHGGGLMTFAKLSAIFEPVNIQRQIIGFDTFTGFPKISDKDIGTETAPKVGDRHSDSYDDLVECAQLYDMNRFLGHINRVSLVKGDATETIPKYLRENPYLVVSLLYLDFDLYEPTKVAIRNFFPRIPRGGIIAFDELNNSASPGETIAVMEEIGISKLKIERMSYDSYLSFAVID